MTLYSYEQLYDAALDRIVLVKKQLKLITAAYHKEQGHAGDWVLCSLDPCRRSVEVLGDIDRGPERTGRND